MAFPFTHTYRKNCAVQAVNATRLCDILIGITFQKRGRPRLCRRGWTRIGSPGLNGGNWSESAWHARQPPADRLEKGDDDGTPRALSRARNVRGALRLFLEFHVRGGGAGKARDRRAGDD